MFDKAFKSEVRKQLDEITERLASDRRAVPVLKDIVKLLKKENADLKDRLMARSFQEYSIYQRNEDSLPVEHFQSLRQEEDLSDHFAGEVVNFDDTSNEMVEP